MHHDFFRIKNDSQLPSCLPDPPVGMNWSRALWGIQKGGWTAVYRPLNLALMYFRDDP